MNNLYITIDEYFEGLKKIKQIINYKEDLNTKLQKCIEISKELDIDLTSISYIINRVYERIYLLDRKLDQIKSILIKIDPSILELYENDSKNIYIEETEEQKLDKLKNTNSDTGANKTLDTTSILEMLKTKKGVNLLLDTLKTSNGSVNSVTSLNTVSILNKEM